MKYGYNESRKEMGELGMNGFEGAVWSFWIDAYLGFMKRKTLDKKTEKALNLLKDMVKEMEEHADTLKKI